MGPQAAEQTRKLDGDGQRVAAGPMIADQAPQLLRRGRRLIMLLT
jgi:hypothetical protein